MWRMRAVAFVACNLICTAVHSFVDVGAATTTCSIAATTVSNYAASTSIAAAVIEKADCTVNVVPVEKESNDTVQLDLSSRGIVHVKSLPSVTKLYLYNNSIAYLGNSSIPSAVKMLDLSRNSFTSLQNFTFPNSLTKLYASNGKLTSLRNVSLPSTITTLNFSNNPIVDISGVVFPSSLKVLSITSTVKLAEFEVRQTDATLFAGLQTFNVSKTTSLVCSDSNAVYRYVEDTLLCVLTDEAFNSKYGFGNTSASGSADVAAVTIAPELPEAQSDRRSKFLLFAAISLSLAFAGLMSTLAPRTLYARYQTKKYTNLLKMKQEQAQVVKPTVLQMPETQRDPHTQYWDL